MTAATTNAPIRRPSTRTRWEQLRHSDALRDLLRDLLRESAFWTAPYSGFPLSRDDHAALYRSRRTSNGRTVAAAAVRAARQRAGLRAGRVVDIEREAVKLNRASAAREE